MRATVVSSVLLVTLLAGSAHALSFAPFDGSPYSTVSPPLEPGQMGDLGGVVAADFNGDGISDIAVVDSGGVPSPRPGESVTVFLGSRSGALALAPGSPFGVYSGGEYAATGPIVAADFNGDGRLDLAVVDRAHSAVYVLLGDGLGRFSPAGPPIGLAGGVQVLVTGDFNGDGIPDLAVVGSQVAVLLGNGTGGFALAPGSPFALPEGASAAAAGGFDGQGRSDLAVAEPRGEVRVFLASSTGELKPAPGLPVAISTLPAEMASVDVNQDGKVDLVTADPNRDAMSVLLGDGSGTFVQAFGSPFNVPSGTENPAAPGLPQSLAVGEFSCPGKPAAALANFNASSDTVAILEDDGHGAFTNAPGSPFPVGGNPRGVAVGDFDGDGAPDLAVADTAHDQLTVLDDTAAAQPCAVPRSADVPPRVDALALGARRVRVRHPIKIHFTLSRSGTAVVELERVLLRRPASPPRSGPVRRTLAPIGSFALAARAGPNRFAINRVHDAWLGPGTYEVVVFTKLRAARSPSRTATFTIAR